MFYNNSVGANFVCLFLVVGFTVVTKAISVPKELQTLEFKSSDEESSAYDETLKANNEQNEDCKCKNGICVNDGKRDICTCPTGWGKYTSYECRECECGKGINCTFYTGFWSDDKYCICPDGKTLKNEPCKDFCDSNPCKNGGTCLNQANGYDCSCPVGFSGTKCEIKDPCLNHKCQNDGVCKPDGRSYICDCKDPYWGDKCEYKCDCINGECHKNSDGHARCVCLPGFGKYTEHECRACDCGKGFNCTFDVSFFNDEKYCLCPGGVQVKNDKCKDFCEPSPCKHGGTCENIANDYKCTCPKDYYGRNCECTCKNGECQNTTNGHFECVCKSEYGLYNEKECREINPTTSSHLNISTSVPDLKTTTNNSIWTTSERFNWTTYLTAKPSNYSHDYNLTTVEHDTTPSPVTETPNITLVDFLTTKPTNYSRDYNLTTTEVSSTPLTTTSDTVNTTATSSVNKTTIDTTATTVTVDTTTTSSEKPSTSDRGIQIIFRNDYTIRNLTEVKIKM